MRKLNYLMACMAMLAFGQGFAQTALVQFIHNSGDAQLQSIDIYADETLIVSSLNYHFATGYLEVPADVVVNWAIAPAGQRQRD